MSLKPGPRGSRGSTRKKGLVLWAAWGSEVLTTLRPSHIQPRRPAEGNPPPPKPGSPLPALEEHLAGDTQAHGECPPALEGPAQGSQAPQWQPAFEVKGHRSGQKLHWAWVGGSWGHSRGTGTPQSPGGHHCLRASGGQAACTAGSDSLTVLKSSLLVVKLPRCEERPPDALEKAARTRPGAQRCTPPARSTPRPAWPCG